MLKKVSGRDGLHNGTTAKATGRLVKWVTFCGNGMSLEARLYCSWPADWSLVRVT